MEGTRELPLPPLLFIIVYRVPGASGRDSKQPVDAVDDLFVVYELASVGFLDASLHSCDEAVLIFEHAG